jgi:hypothetical protein
VQYYYLQAPVPLFPTKPSSIRVPRSEVASARSGGFIHAAPTLLVVRPKGCSHCQSKVKVVAEANDIFEDILSLSTQGRDIDVEIPHWKL